MSRILEKVSGWAHTTEVDAYVVTPHNLEELRTLIAEVKSARRRICLRGAGLTFGDAIVSANNYIVDLTGLNRILNWSPATGILTAEPGVTFGQIFEKTYKSRWILASVPGSTAITIGGALGMNTHGKNGWKEGNIGDHVLEFELMCADGTTIVCNRLENQELFYAAVGGLGLLGIFTRITLQLKRIPSYAIKRETVTAANLAETITRLEEIGADAEYLVVMTDSFAHYGSRHMGRSVIQYAKFIAAKDLKVQVSNGLADRACPLAERLVNLKALYLLWKALGLCSTGVTAKLVNSYVYYRYALLPAKPVIESCYGFFFINDFIPLAKFLFLEYSVYKRQGVFELQACIPQDKFLEVYRNLFESIQRGRLNPYLTGIKMHKQDDFLLSPYVSGYSINIDIPNFKGREHEIDELFAEMNAIVARHGGRTYLAKDDKLRAEQFKMMYPHHERFRQIKAKYDPDHLFHSEMYQRLFEPNLCSTRVLTV